MENTQEKREAGDKLIVSTPYGDFTILLALGAAPITASYFKKIAREGVLDSTSFFRIVRDENNSHNPGVPIHVIQAGLSDYESHDFPQILHETTQMTGLSHQKFTVSAARIGPGEVYGSFFVTMRDEHALDFGGPRHPDGQGFAAFGRIIAGFDVLENIFMQAEDQEYLQKTIPIDSVKLA